VRILLFHAYLLRGTGSNVYNAALARAMAGLGHDVRLFCQDRAAGELDWVDAVGTWAGGELSVDGEPGEGRVTVYIPDIGRVLPVYVADDYEGFDAITYDRLPDADLERYLDANVAAVRDVVSQGGVDVALANHLVMGPVILARALGGRVPYAVKVHGSALEYTVRPNRERFLPYAREGLAQAGGVLVGSLHTGASLWEVVDEPDLRERTRLGPPGVDTSTFRPREPAEARAALDNLAGRLQGAAAASWGGEAGASDALRTLDPARDEIVSFVGKLIVSKGVDLLLAAWPLVHARSERARLVVVGFGAYREVLERLRRALGAGDLDEAHEIARLGRALEGGPAAELSYLTAFLDGLDGDRRASYLAAAPAAMDRVAFTGRLEHEDLPDLLGACRAQVVPSTFPEAFGMVAAEAAACGVLPIVANHSGLAEVARTFAAEVDGPVRRLLTFERGPRAVEDLADRLSAWLGLAPEERSKAVAALARTAHERYSWEGVARGVIAAARGELDSLLKPGA
jgi:glycosyltransferase involved in cell wall biosynthesis